MWIWFALTVTVSTIYLGWHYVLDDLAGIIIALTALVLARALTGFDLRSTRQRARVARSRQADGADGQPFPATA